MVINFNSYFFPPQLEVILPHLLSIFFVVIINENYFKFIFTVDIFLLILLRKITVLNFLLKKWDNVIFICIFA